MNKNLDTKDIKKQIIDKKSQHDSLEITAIGITIALFMIIREIVSFNNLYIIGLSIIPIIAIIGFFIVYYIYYPKNNYFDDKKNKLEYILIMIELLYFIIISGGLYVGGGINSVAMLVFFPYIVSIIIDPKDSNIFLSYLYIDIILFATLFIFGFYLFDFTALFIINIFMIVTGVLIKTFADIMMFNYLELVEKNTEEDVFENDKRENINFLKTTILEIDEFIKRISIRKDIKKNIVELKIIEQKLKDRQELLDGEKLNISIFQFNKIVSSVLQELFPLMKDKAIQIQYLPYINEDLEINNDRDKIYSILLYCIENAILFSNDEGILTIITKKERDNISVSIRNNTDTEIDLKNLFKLGNTTKKGTREGVGLYISKSFSNLTKTDIQIHKDYANLIIVDLKVKIIL